MRLSIITINLNNRKGLQRTIDSVISQTFHDFEWIVIDGGSTDGSKELLEQYANHFAYWVSEPDKGIYNAMNKGIQMANGDYSLFLNTGDYLRETAILDKVFSVFPGGDIIYGNLSLIYNGKEKEKRLYPNNPSFYDIYQHSLPHPSTFIKTSLLKNSPYDEQFRIAADWKFFLKMALDSIEFHHIEIFVSCFDLQGVSSTNTKLLQEERDVIAHEVIPSCILNDIKKKEEPLDWQIDALLSFREKSKIHHKIATVILTCLKKMAK